MKTLHILNKSPKTPFPASQCARFISEQDSVLLIEDAVYYALPSTIPLLLSTSLQSETTAIYALKEDLEARGILALAHKGVQLVSYDGFVELTASHDKSTSWY
ncbi:sulfurtransferase complex subunit TusB [Alkalimarinus coralli]|uniref:sulfurtransferase complex subunit TusB n=1 Tax=Alkalimarinus coralli TaxID=2935863 RepID=UPI00202B7E18|nr:sulfurtransferase complex subunit TusB [Alkalimarinus coralli]